MTAGVGIVAFYGEWHLCMGSVLTTPSLYPSPHPRIVLVDFPNTTGFLTPEERAFIVHRKSTYTLCWNLSDLSLRRAQKSTTTLLWEKRSTSHLDMYGRQ